LKTKLISPLSVIWALCHLSLIFLGFLFFYAKPLHGLLTEAVAAAIGVSLIATGISGLVVFLYVRSSEKLQAQIGVLEQAGLVNVFGGRSVTIRDEYNRRFHRARQIDVLGFGQSSLRQDHLSSFVSWSHRAHVRILLIDPEFLAKRYSLADQRDREEGNSRGSIAQDVRTFLEDIGKLEGLNRERFQIRLARVLPTTSIFRIDNELFFGPYLLGQQSRNSPTFLVREGGYLFRHYKDHFDNVWRSDEFSQEVRPS
jgi:hypothetical protein